MREIIEKKGWLAMRMEGIREKGRKGRREE